jgi:cytochrome c oxidase subunit 2
LGAGTLNNDAANLADWIAHVQRHKPGAQMPGYERLDAATLEAIAAYLEQLR